MMGVTGGGLRVSERERLRDVEAPAARVVIAACREYMAQLDLSVRQMAACIGKGESTLKIFLYSGYAKRLGVSDIWIRRAVWDYIQRNPIAAEPRRAKGRLFVTENYKRIRRYFTRAKEHGEMALIYGPPGTQKTFVFEHLLAESNRAEAGRVLYVYASQNMKPLALLKRIARAVGAHANMNSAERLLTGLQYRFRAMQGAPAVLVDEAQHLDVACLETLRELHDLSGCGLVLAGSHNLYEKLVRGKAQLEQLISRCDHTEPLPGLLPDEVRQIAERELGVTLTKKQLGTILKACAVKDAFARKEYLSVRRLVKFLAQMKDERDAREAA